MVSREKRQFDQQAIVRDIICADDVCRLVLECKAICAAARPGQFVMLKTGSETSNDPLLRRPFSIHRVDGDCLTLVYKIVGRGTALLSEVRQGVVLQILGPLGQGFVLKENVRHYLVGGGMGIAPLFFLAETLREKWPDAQLLALLGARTKQELDHFQTMADVSGIEISIATDDGSVGHHGFVTELLAAAAAKAPGGQVYCCGPEMMMKKVAHICRDHGLPCQVSLESHMACGIGACLGCAVRGTETGEKKGYLHVCKEGPVFEAGLIWS